MASLIEIAASTADGSDQRKTAAAAKRHGQPAATAIRIEDAASIRAVLRSAHTLQAGFGAELMKRDNRLRNLPVVLADGEPHRRQRSATARFFSPKAVGTRYRPLMERLADHIVSRIAAAGRADLEVETMELAVGVAADIVGLADGDCAGLSRRLEGIFRTGVATGGGPVARIVAMARRGLSVSNFLLRDLRPAIRARRGQPREDVISHLLEQGYNTQEILTECLTYAAAGMVTTREFIVVATWHLLERPELRARFLAAGEADQMTMLEEILRAEPVVGVISRRLTESIELPGGKGRLEKGALVELDVRGGNSDAAMVGAEPHRIDFGRATAGKHPAAMFSFGDGAHRCPGAAVAVLESVIFLDRLLRLPGLRLAQEPRVGWADTIGSYEVCDAVIRCG